ncbi:MAG: dehydrogenase [Planctomycetaceae bacterium]|nr:dehydrogenase [Planctomycetaceae bacterium]
MPKALMIDPQEMRSSEVLDFKPIHLNHYDKSVVDELSEGKVSKEDLLFIQRDMMIIRAFESMLETVKKQGHFNNIEYNHRGPAHLSIGQEASAVGQAFLLGTDDHIYGSHRSHGEILAKSLSAIRKLEDASLMAIMTNYFGGDCLRVVEKDFQGEPQDLAMDFIVYGALAEIFARDTGLNRGFGGSMHAFFPPFGVYPNNAIVGGSADISVGAALNKHVNKKPGLVIANIGDAAAACGPTWEALCFATMDQFKELWDEAHRGGLPLIMNFVNNFYGMGGQPVGETMGFKVLARMGAGLNPDQMHAERVDGYNPLAVVDAIRRKREIIQRGDGPVLLDTVTYRFSGHSPSDASSYREKDEIDAWQDVDPINTFASNLMDAGVCTQTDLDAMQANVDALILRSYQKAVDLEISPRANQKNTKCLLEQVMFSDDRVEKMEDRPADTNLPLAENPRFKQLERRSRFGLDENGKPLPKQRCIAVRDALFEAIIDRFYADPTLVAYGEENRDWGGAFAVYRGLTEALPYHRLFNSPISEASIVGTAVGYALEGGRVIAELMYCDFMGRAGDEIFNQLAKWQSMSGGLLKMPVVLRVSVGSKYGAQHSQDWTSMCAHIPGLKVVFPATPYDAKGLMYSALMGTDPVVFFESQRLYDQPELFHEGGVPTEAYEIPFGEPDIKKAGNDLTILSIGATLYRALDAAEELADKYGISCEVIDARTIVPFNFAKVIESIKKTRKIVLTSDACERGSALQTFAAKITQFAFDELDGPPVVVGARNWITPADEIEDSFFPQPSDIIDAIHEHILPLQGYKPVRECSTSELLRRSEAGV